MKRLMQNAFLLSFWSVVAPRVRLYTASLRPTNSSKLRYSAIGLMKGCKNFLGIFICLPLGHANVIPEDEKLGSPYCRDPHAWAVESIYLKGPCGRQQSGYLTRHCSKAIPVKSTPTPFDRTTLINPEIVVAPPRPKVKVEPLDQPSSTLSTHAPLIDGTLDTFQTSDSTTWNVSTSEADFKDPNIHLLPLHPEAAVTAPVLLNESVSLPVENPVLIAEPPAQLSLPAQLLHFFQQPLNTHPYQNAVVLPFELPLQTDLKQGDIKGNSRAVYQVD